MFNETSYPGCGLSDAEAVQRRLDAGKKVKQSKLDKFAIVAPPGYGTLPLPKTKPPKGVIGTAVGPRVDEEPLMPAGATDPGTPADAGSSGGGFDLGGIFSALPWWAWALGAYFLLKKR